MSAGLVQRREPDSGLRDAPRGYPQCRPDSPPELAHEVLHTETGGARKELSAIAVFARPRFVCLGLEYPNPSRRRIPRLPRLGGPASGSRPRALASRKDSLEKAASRQPYSDRSIGE